MAHVPKFGDWDSDNVPYTAFFENARKDRGTKMINPNDPEQNPEAFMIGRGDHGKQQQQHKKQINGEEDAFDEDLEGPRHRFRSADHKGSSDSHRDRSHKSRKSDSSSDKSNSDYALKKSNRRAERYGQTRTSAEGSSSSTPSVEQARSKGGNGRVDRIPQQVASVPKFGSWDATDPRSGEGFTVIFNKVKEEKQNNASRLPTIPADTSFNPSNGHKHHGDSKSGSKKCCGLF